MLLERQYGSRRLYRRDKIRDLRTAKALDPAILNMPMRPRRLLKLYMKKYSQISERMWLNIPGLIKGGCRRRCYFCRFSAACNRPSRFEGILHLLHTAFLGNPECSGQLSIASSSVSHQKNFCFISLSSVLSSGEKPSLSYSFRLLHDAVCMRLLFNGRFIIRKNPEPLRCFCTSFTLSNFSIIE